MAELEAEAKSSNFSSSCGQKPCFVSSWPCSLLAHLWDAPFRPLRRETTLKGAERLVRVRGPVVQPAPPTLLSPFFMYVSFRPLLDSKCVKKPQTVTLGSISLRLLRSCFQLYPLLGANKFFEIFLIGLYVFTHWHRAYPTLPVFLYNKHTCSSEDISVVFIGKYNFWFTIISAHHYAFSSLRLRVTIELPTSLWLYWGNLIALDKGRRQRWNHKLHVA